MNQVIAVAPAKLKPREYLRQRASFDYPIVRQPETSAIAGYSDDHLRRLERAGDFPARFKLNARGGRLSAVGWDRAEVMAWVAERRASRQA